MSDKADDPNVLTKRFKEIAQQATILSEAYRLRLVGRLWWANMALVVLPAVCATAAAIFAAGGTKNAVAATLAGAAAVLSAIHKSLKCQEYQDECLRLSSGYAAIAVRAESAQMSREQDKELKDLTDRFAELEQSTKAPLPDTYITKAEKLYQERVSLT